MCHFAYFSHATVAPDLYKVLTNLRYLWKRCTGDLTNPYMYVLLLISAHFDLASTKSCHSPNWRVQNRFGEYEIEVTRRCGEYEFFLMSNPAIYAIHILLFHENKIPATATAPGVSVERIWNELPSAVLCIWIGILLIDVSGSVTDTTDESKIKQMSIWST